MFPVYIAEKDWLLPTSHKLNTSSSVLNTILKVWQIRTRSTEQIGPSRLFGLRILEWE